MANAQELDDRSVAAAPALLPPPFTSPLFVVEPLLHLDVGANGNKTAGPQLKLLCVELLVDGEDIAELLRRSRGH
jgi:hypothetical protein